MPKIGLILSILSRKLWKCLTVKRTRQPLPVVLTLEEVNLFLDNVEDIKYKAMFATMYSSGMRVSEVIHLHYDDISRSNMQIHVRNTKNRMDRYTILSKKNLDILTRYWFERNRPIAKCHIVKLDGLHALLYRLMESPITPESLMTKLSEYDYNEKEISEAIKELDEMALIIYLSGRYLALALPV